MSFFCTSCSNFDRDNFRYQGQILRSGVKIYSQQKRGSSTKMHLNLFKIIPYVFFPIQ